MLIWLFFGLFGSVVQLQSTSTSHEDHHKNTLLMRRIHSQVHDADEANGVKHKFLSKLLTMPQRDVRMLYIVLMADRGLQVKGGGDEISSRS